MMLNNLECGGLPPLSCRELAPGTMPSALHTMECGGLPPLSCRELAPGDVSRGFILAMEMVSAWAKDRLGAYRRGQAPYMKAAASRRTPYWAIALALMLATATHAQEAFDAEKTKALFAGSEWVTYLQAGHKTLNHTFAADGTMTTIEVGQKSGKSAKWIPSSPRSVSGDDKEWMLSPDGRELYATGNNFFRAFYRGTKMPPAFPFLLETLAKPGIIWVKQGSEERETLAFNGEWEVAHGKNGIEQKAPSLLSRYGGGLLYTHGITGAEPFICLIQDGKGERVLRNVKGTFYKPEPAQPGDPVPPNPISRAKSPFGGTSWCRMDEKGKVLMLTFAASGTVSDSNFPNEKPEWNPYDNGSVRYKVKNETRKMKLSEDKKYLIRENDMVREIWYSGRQPPKMSMTETKQIKDMLGNKDKAWASWDDGKKTVYTFDDKSANVDITVDNIKQKTVRWEMLCAGCIRIGDEAFMIEGETLERVEPRLTLKQVPKDSVR